MRDDDFEESCTCSRPSTGRACAIAAGFPDGDVRGTVQLVHGASEHSGRYGRLAAALTGHGYGVWAMDLRGHGRTAESTGIGRFGGLGVDTVLDDVDALHLVMDDQHPGVPRVLLGHSMGSIIALASAERNGSDLAGLALSGPIGVAPHLADTVTALEEAVAAGAADHALDALGPSTRRSSRPARATTGCRGTPPRSTPTSPTR